MLGLGFLRDVVATPLLTAAVLVFLSVPGVIAVANYLGLIDDPKKRPHPAHTETRVIPRAGGLAIFLGFVIAVFLYIPFAKQVAGVVLGGALLVFVGLIDDKEDVHPYIRLFGANLGAALLAVGAGAGIPYITSPFGGTISLTFWRVTIDFMGQHSFYPLADGAAVIWIMWVINMVGWSGGVDGQLPGFVAIAAFFIGILSLGQVGTNNFPYWVVATISFITAGAYLGFLPWNFFPQRIMPGYGGKALAGFLLAVVSVLSVTKVGTAIVILGVPMIDAIYVIIGRMIRRHSPVWGSNTHLHHRLLAAGWSKRRIALFYWAISAILGTVALFVGAQQKFFVIITLAVILLAVVLWLNFYTSWRKHSESDSGPKTF